MMSEQRILGLVGSPRAKSTSEMLARHLTDSLTERGWQAEVQRISPAIRQAERWPALEAKIRAADVVALVFPLYIDALPAETTLALERLAASYQVQPLDHPQCWLAVVNCGFMEAHHNDVALAICHQFTREAHVTWSGGLAIGGGGSLGGRSLKDMGNMVNPITTACAMTIDALHAGQPVPAEAEQLIRKCLFPPWLYFTMANLSMYKAAFDHGNLFRMGAQPYAKSR
ncbi:MAG: NAD(P)H-dependent oxidoreductase [Armatimonadota bacterium]